MSALPAPAVPVPEVRCEKRGRVAYVTLQRPQVLNALNLAAHAQLGEIWDDIEADDGIWLAVLTGSGERAFCVGQDLKELARRNQSGAAPSSFGSQGAAGWPRLTERFGFSKPLLARVNGLALGGGFELALACDIVIAAEHAEFGLPEARLGLIPGAGGVFRLCRQLPLKTAMGHLLTGRRLGAQRAFDLGLVNQVVPAAQLDDCVQAWVSDLLRAAPLSQRAIKQAAMRSLDMPLPDAFQAHYPAETQRRSSRDCAEGPRAFVEKREPLWTAT